MHTEILILCIADGADNRIRDFADTDLQGNTVFDKVVGDQFADPYFFRRQVFKVRGAKVINRLNPRLDDTVNRLGVHHALTLGKRHGGVQFGDHDFRMVNGSMESFNR